MKAKLTKITGIYTLLDDNDKMIASDDVDMQKDYEIGKLSKQNCDKIFGVVDVEKFVKEHWENDKELNNPSSFKAGFNKAMELNKDKVFTLEDMQKAFELGHNGAADTYMLEKNEQEFEKLIQQPTEIEVEIVMRNSRTGNIVKHDSDLEWDEDGLCDRAIPKLNSEGCLILKKI
jgi:hypothetical protein